MATGLGVGDLVEAGSLLGGLSEEQVILQVVEENAPLVRFEATLFGVHLGYLDTTVDDTGVVIGGEFHE